MVDPDQFPEYPIPSFPASNRLFRQFSDPKPEYPIPMTPGELLPGFQPGSLERRIGHAYMRLGGFEPGQRMGRDLRFTEIRALMPDVSRADFDAAASRLSLGGGVAHIMPETSQRDLTPADRAAATHLGGKDQHNIRFTLPEWR